MIIRVVRHEQNFTMIDNASLRDITLSFKATGLLAYLLSMPDEWSPRRDQLAEVKTDGVASIRAALKELVDAGYLVRTVDRLPDGRTVTVSHVHERPISPEAGNQPVEMRKSHSQRPKNRPAVDQPAVNQPAKEVSLTKDCEQKRTPYGEIRTQLRAIPRGAA